MGEPYRILVTGDRDEEGDFPARLSTGRAMEWIPVEVLRFERLAVDPQIVSSAVEQPFDWVLFTSSRAVRFWTEVLVENGAEFPLETQVACIGEKTAELAANDGYTPDFYPTEPGTEKFLEEFRDLLSNSAIKPRVLIPMAQGGRLALAEELSRLGCQVTVIPLYRTLPKDEIELPPGGLQNVSAILFTSPSSVDSLTSRYSIPSHVKVVALGKYTAEHLKKKGLSGERVLPGSDFHRIEEVLA